MTRVTRETAAGRAYLDLQNRARRDGRPSQEYLTMYVAERWLARLARSAYVDDFVLKGGMLLAVFGNRRPTVDADALARNLANDEAAVSERVADIAAIELDDGVEFIADTVTTAQIRDDALYAGVRISMNARIATAKLKLRVDVNFGDPVTPGPQRVDLPALRPDAPAVEVLGYPIETVIAEKLVTAIDLGETNTRVRDFADLYALLTARDLEGGVVREAIAATSDYRGVALIPTGAAFDNVVELRAATYRTYRTGLGAAGSHLPDAFADVVRLVSRFADPLMANDDGVGSWCSEHRRWEA